MKIGILGAGSWGTTLGALLAKKGYKVIIWARRKELAHAIKKNHENPSYFPGIKLPSNLTADHSLAKSIKGKDLILVVVPSHAFREIIKKAQKYLDKNVKAIISATKGIENKTLLTMTRIMEEELPSAFHGCLGVLSGPSFAKEVLEERPTAVTVAARDSRVAQLVQETFFTSYFRVYRSYDILGVELGGALKNVIAIAAGISDGLGLGTNPRAALITRGLAEISRLAIRMGANPLTLAGLAGLGDLVLTCTGPLSRNRTVGLKLGHGDPLDKIVSELKMVAEGVKTTQAAYALAKKYKVEMPITEKVYQVLYEGKNPREAVNELMIRTLKDEFE